MSNQMSNQVFPNHSVAPICIGKIYSLYRTHGTNVYRLYINTTDEIVSIVDDNDLDTLIHTLNEIKAYHVTCGHPYIIKLNLDVIEMGISVFKRLYRALVQHYDNMDTYIYNAVGYGALLATLGRGKILHVDANYYLYLPKKDVDNNPNLIEFTKRHFGPVADIWGTDDSEAHRFSLGMKFSIDELYSRKLIDYVDTYDEVVTAKDYIWRNDK